MNELVFDCVARGQTARALPKKLPPTAIYCHFRAAKPIRSMHSFHSQTLPVFGYNRIRDGQNWALAT